MEEFRSAEDMKEARFAWFLRHPAMVKWCWSLRKKRLLNLKGFLLSSSSPTALIRPA